MRRSLPAALALGAVLVLASCGDDPAPTQAPRAGAPQLYLAPTPTAIRGQIDLLFVAGTPRDGALSQFDNVFRKKEASDDRTAQRLALTLINFVIQKYKSRELLDPAGPFVSPTTREAVADLVRAIYQYAFGTAIDEENLRDMLGLSTFTQVVGPEGAVILEPDVFLLDIPEDALREFKLVTVKQLSNNPVPLPQTLGPTYPFYVEFTITPEQDVTETTELAATMTTQGGEVGHFHRLVTFGFCVAEPENGGPPTVSYDRLRAGHEGTDGRFELLPLIEDGRLFCAGQSTEYGTFGYRSDPDAGFFANSAHTFARVASRAWGFFAPTPAYAGHSGLTSLLGSQDTFGAVDPGNGPANLVVSPDPVDLSLETPPRDCFMVPDGCPQRQVTLEAVVTDAGGVEVPKPPTITWSSSDPTIANFVVVVDPESGTETEVSTVTGSTAIVRGQRDGTVVITATGGGVTGFATVTVHPANNPEP